MTDPDDPIERALSAWAADLRSDHEAVGPRTPWCPTLSELAWMGSWGVDPDAAAHVLACARCSGWLLRTWTEDEVPAGVLAEAANPERPTGKLLRTDRASTILLPAPVRIALRDGVAVDVGLVPATVRLVLAPEQEHARLELELAFDGIPADGGEKDALVALARARWREWRGTPLAGIDVAIAASRVRRLPGVHADELSALAVAAGTDALRFLQAVPGELLARTTWSRGEVRAVLAELVDGVPEVAPDVQRLVAGLPTSPDEPDARLLADERHLLKDAPVLFGAGSPVTRPTGPEESPAVLPDADVAAAEVLALGALALSPAVLDDLRRSTDPVADPIAAEQALWRLRALTPAAAELVTSVRDGSPLLDLVLVEDGQVLDVVPQRIDLASGELRPGLVAAAGAVVIVTFHEQGADPPVLAARSDRQEVVGRWRWAAAGHRALAARAGIGRRSLLRRWRVWGLTSEAACLELAAGQGEAEPGARRRARGLVEEATALDPELPAASRIMARATPSERICSNLASGRAELAARVRRRATDDPDGRLLPDARELGGQLLALDALLRGTS